MTGWIAALPLAIAVARLRRRLELVARAEHELRGPLTAFSLALEVARRTPAGGPIAETLDAELARARAGLADLSAARTGGRARAVPQRVALEPLVRSSAAAWAPAARRVRLDWRAGSAQVMADRSRLAQVLGNAISNAVEHGSGDLVVRGRSNGGRVRVEVENPVERGRGLGIASAAARDSGGRLALTTLDLPLAK